MKTAIRLDDITVNMDWERFLTVKTILDKAGIKPLIGVVPYPEDDNLDRFRNGGGAKTASYIPVKKWSEAVKSAVPTDEESWADYLKSLRDDGWVIALHGFNHLYTTDRKGLFPLNNFSEFAGVPYFNQLNMIKKGLEKVKEWGIETDIFMAPGHTYDMNTLKALLASGIKKVTDGFGVRPYRRIVGKAGRAEALTFYPISRKRSECTSDKYGFTTLVLHCNTMTDKDMKEFEDLLKVERDHFIDYGDYITEPPADRFLFGNIGEYLTALAKYTLVGLRAKIKNSKNKEDAYKIKSKAKADKSYGKGADTKSSNKKAAKEEPEIIDFDSWIG